MNNQERLIIIDYKEKKEILKLLKDYRTIVDKGYEKTKKAKPYQSITLANLVNVIREIDKTIKMLEGK